MATTLSRNASLISTRPGSTMEAKNDLGLTESMPERDLEAYTAAKEAGEPLEAIKTSASRGPNQLTSTLSRTLSKVRTSDTLDPGPPPDGGFQAWATAVWTDCIPEHKFSNRLC